jgi:hypothetical protein
MGPAIPLLDISISKSKCLEATIAGVSVEDINVPITNIAIQCAIEEAISKLTLGVKYNRPRNLECEKGK